MADHVIAENVRKYRDERRWTQPQLASKLGVSVQTISNWETGLKVPRMGSLQKLADVFHVTIGDLTSTTKHEVKTADLADDDTIFTYKGQPLSDDDKEIIRRLMNGK